MVAVEYGQELWDTPTGESNESCADCHGDVSEMAGVRDVATLDKKEVEDKIAAPLIDQHLALGTGEDKRIAVVSRAIMKAVSAELTRSGLGGAKLYADFDGISHSSEPLLLPDRLVHPGSLGYTVDRAWAKTDAQERSTQQVLNLINIETAINLRTGDFAPKANVMIGRVQLMRAAALLAVSGLVWLGLLGAQNRSMFEHAAFIRSETARMYSEFTGQTAPANPALSVVRNVKSNGQSQVDFLNLSQILFQAIEMTDGVSVETLQFDENQNQLTLRVRYPQFESASELEQSVAASGGEFRAGGIREQGGKLIGDAVLIAGAGS